ncbi:Acyl-protein thioesterase 1 [Tolypocladium ophioglossoides CBS 100239]|uniref:Acyl-protein thioesterase 1 n=1 Tax=Tolypocladium ophioglossoides (strain CBS 100239) TaxID=1163406 RepID=A0A0L0NLD3_TOLOC|nr:Acyl-protein thioesterase 1 [Tolypocladium ophioglossoides CBS 100239]
MAAAAPAPNSPKTSSKPPCPPVPRRGRCKRHCPAGACSPTLWSTTFQEAMPAWFDAHSLTDTTARQDLQVDGIRASVAHVCGIVEDEIARLDGRADRLVLGGISQGGAVALWSLLCRRHAAAQRLGAFVGLSTWLPFADEIRQVLGGTSTRRDEVSPFGVFVTGMMEPLRDALHQPQSNSESPFLRTPVFIGHGSDDAYVDVELGRQVTDALLSIGLRVEWRDYVGADEEGHWLKRPEELDDIHSFLARAAEQPCK